MSSRRAPAHNHLTILFAALAALLNPAPAIAQSDPFALPDGVTAKTVSQKEGPGLSEIVVDGALQVRMVELAWQGDGLTIDADNARVAGLPVAEGATGPLDLDSLEIVSWEFDRFRQRLSVELYRDSDGANLIDFHDAPPRDGRSAPLTALRLDYDLTATLQDGKAAVNGFTNAIVVRDDLAFGTTAQFTTDPVQDRSAVTRLESSVQLTLPDDGLILTGGDFISAGTQSQRAIRMGGIQLATDFTLRPDLVTTPLPAFTGQVAVPTDIELISASQRLELGEVEPGEFTVRNVPTAAGRGEIAVVLTDNLGRQIVRNTRFYTSRSLLAPDLSQFALNAGFVRRRYGEVSNDYGDFVASAFYRRGLSPHLTVEGSAEWTQGTFNAGGRLDAAIGGFALASVDFRLSEDSSFGTGSLVGLTFESVGQGLSIRGGAIVSSANYRDAASSAGDPAPPTSYFGQVSYDLSARTRLQLSATRRERVRDQRLPLRRDRSDVVDLSLRTRLFDRVELFASGTYNRGRRSAFGAFLGVSMQFGGGRSGQASVNANDFGMTGSAAFRKFDNETGDLGYSLEANVSDRFQRVAASVTKRAEFARVSAQIEQVDGGFAARAIARGTVLVADGAVFARNQTGGAFALVRAGDVDGVTITRENREAGVTTRGGLLLIENIPPDVAISIDVDPDKLPADALARATYRRVAVPRSAVGLVELDVIRFIPVLRRVVDEGGTPLPAGLSLVAQPSGERTLIGFDGYVEINSAAKDRQLFVSLPGGDCRVDISADLSDDEDLDLVCIATRIADETDSEDMRDAAKVARRD